MMRMSEIKTRKEPTNVERTFQAMTLPSDRIKKSPRFRQCPFSDEGCIWWCHSITVERAEEELTKHLKKEHNVIDMEVKKA